MSDLGVCTTPCAQRWVWTKRCMSNNPCKDKPGAKEDRSPFLHHHKLLTHLPPSTGPQGLPPGAPLLPQLRADKLERKAAAGRAAPHPTPQPRGPLRVPRIRGGSARGPLPQPGAEPAAAGSRPPRLRGHLRAPPEPSWRLAARGRGKKQRSRSDGEEYETSFA
nr:translation initiation factor IF-2 [Anser cygnoides]